MLLLFVFLSQRNYQNKYLIEGKQPFNKYLIEGKQTILPFP